MITVFGAHGNTGSVVAKKLLEAGQRVRAVARDEQKLEALRALGAEVMKADVKDPEQVSAALAGATGAYLLLPPDPRAHDVVSQNRRIVDNYLAALTAHSVAHAVVLSSVGSQHASGTGPIVTTRYAEQTLQKAPATKLTFLRAAYFMENFLSNAQTIKQDGVLPVFGGGENFAFPMVATADIGATAAEALLRAPSATEWIELEGPKSYSYVDAAAEASKVLGRSVTATPLPMERLVPMLKSFGFSDSFAGLYREMLEGAQKGLLSFEGTGRHLTGKTELRTVLEHGLG